VRIRADVVIFAVLVAGSAAAVMSQLEPAPPDVPPPPPIGTQVSDFTLKDIGNRDRSLSELSKGKAATVLYFWSIGCPCVDDVEPRMHAIVDKYEPLGVTFVAIDADPTDEREAIIEKMGRIRATKYRMLLDPAQKVVKETGVRKSTEVVVLDRDRRIRYRGALDDDYLKPKVPHLANALDAVLEGRSPTFVETKTYGCPYPGFEGFCPVDE
jgi:peroxiredoxin